MANITNVEYNLNNENVYTLSNPKPRSDTYNRDGWFYMNHKITNVSDQQCNIKIYDMDDTQAADNLNTYDVSNFLFLQNIGSLYFDVTIMSTSANIISTETVMNYYPYIVIGTKPDGVNDLDTNFKSKMYIRYSPTNTDDVNDITELTYLYKGSRNIGYYLSPPSEDKSHFLTPFKYTSIERNPSSITNFNSEQIKKIWIETSPVSTPSSISFLLHKAGISSKGYVNNYNRIFTFSNVNQNNITNQEELILYNQPLNGYTTPINLYGRNSVVIYANVTATAGNPSKNLFIAYSPDNITYYLDSTTVIVQEYDIAGTYTGCLQLNDVGYQFIKLYTTDVQITNVKIAYSTYN